MKNIKLISVVMAVIMLLCLLSGCSGKKGGEDVDTTNKNYITSKDAFVTKMGSLLDLSQYCELLVGEAEEEYYAYYIIDGNKKDYDLDYTYTLSDGTTLKLPMSFADLEAKGWTQARESSFEIGSGYINNQVVKNSQGKELIVTVFNNTDKKTSVKNCLIVGIASEQFNPELPSEKLETAIGFTVAGGLTQASTLEDIIAKLGNPSVIKLTVVKDASGNYSHSQISVEYAQKSEHENQLKFELSGDGNYIISADYEIAH